MIFSMLKDLVQHPTETTIYKLMFQVPSAVCHNFQSLGTNILVRFLIFQKLFLGGCDGVSWLPKL